MASSLAADSLLEIMSESAKQLGIGSLKEQQIDAISSFVVGHDTFVSLPTGCLKGRAFYRYINLH